MKEQCDRHQSDISYHEDLGKNNRQKTEGGEEKLGFMPSRGTTESHICIEAGDRETPGDAQGTASTI